MNILVVYGTTEGHTHKVAQVVADQARTKSSVMLIDSANPIIEDVRLGDFDAVIVAASLHVGRFQPSIYDFVRKRHDTLNGMRTLFLPVSLSAASKDVDDIKGLQKCLEQFNQETAWRPGRVNNVAGAFRFTQYDFFKRWGMKLIAYQKGVSTDTSQDQELTDWPALSSTVADFLTTVEKARSRRAE
jgi:menaquinone-dependent protoporphyrinogen oxidase